MKRYDRPHRERAEYLKERGWKWEYVGRTPKHFTQSEMKLLRPTISIYRR